MVRAHPIYAADPGLIRFTSLSLSLSLPYFLSVDCLIKVSMPEKILKKKKVIN